MSQTSYRQGHTCKPFILILCGRASLRTLTFCLCLSIPQRRMLLHCLIMFPSLSWTRVANTGCRAQAHPRCLINPWKGSCRTINSQSYPCQRFIGFLFLSSLPPVYRNVAVKIRVSGLQDSTIPLAIGALVLCGFFPSLLATDLLNLCNIEMKLLVH